MIIITEEEKLRILGLYNIPSHRIIMTEGKLNGMSFHNFMEGFRNKLYSPGGAAVEAFLTSFAITAPAVIVSYTAMLAYDIYESVQDGVTNWFNIICDALCVISSGVLSKVISPLLKYKNSFRGLEEFLTWLKNSTLWKTISPWLQKISTGITSISGKVGESITWLSNKTGITFLIKIAGKITSFLNTIATSVSGFIKKITPKAVQPNIVNPIVKTGKAVGQSMKSFGKDVVKDTASKAITGTTDYGDMIPG